MRYPRYRAWQFEMTAHGCGKRWLSLSCRSRDWPPLSPHRHRNRASTSGDIKSNPIPLFSYGVLDQVQISVDQPAGGRLASCRRSDFVDAVIATVPWSFEEPSAGIGPLPMEHSNMAHDLSLAQSHAFQLCRDLMVPVTLFKSGNEFGVLPSDELDDDDDLEIVHEYEPW